MDFSIISYVVAVATAIVGVVSYRQGVKQKRIEFIHSLWDSFWNTTKYYDIRTRLDYEGERQEELYSVVKKILNNDILTIQEIDIAEELNKYLNFFELIASLHENEYLIQTEIENVFSYHINLLFESKDKTIEVYMKKYSFENIAKLHRHLKYG